MMIDADQLPTIKASRVALRWLRENDVEDLFAIFSDAEVMRYWSSPPLDDVESARGLLEGIHESFHGRDLFQWGLVRLEDDRVIGTCTLASIDASHRRAEIGFALARGHWGHGYMVEALTALIDFAFEELHLRRIEADVDPRNEGSLRLMRRLGFQQEGHFRERWDVNGELQDSIMFGLLRREWKA